jgi:Zn-dependent M28 family amino/carboxypeptidase
MGRGFGTAGGRMAADYIITQFKGAGIMPWQGSYLHPFISSGLMAKTEGANVVGWIEGSDSMLKGEYIVIGAHYDHLAYKINDDGTRVVFNGADDNASGVASIIEIESG